MMEDDYSDIVEQYPPDPECVFAWVLIEGLGRPNYLTPECIEHVIAVNTRQKIDPNDEERPTAEAMDEWLREQRAQMTQACQTIRHNRGYQPGTPRWWNNPASVIKNATTP